MITHQDLWVCLDDENEAMCKITTLLLLLMLIFDITISFFSITIADHVILARILTRVISAILWYRIRTLVRLWAVKVDLTLAIS